MAKTSELKLKCVPIDKLSLQASSKCQSQTNDYVLNAFQSFTSYK